MMFVHHCYTIRKPYIRSIPKLCHYQSEIEGKNENFDYVIDN